MQALKEPPTTTSPSSGVTVPLVTICVPTIGRTRYLDAALKSIREQTYQNYEVLILDNASGPQAQDILARFAADTPHVRILRVDERVPMFANFNRGIRAALGDYIVFFHDDDLYQPAFIATHVAALEANPRAAFAAGNYDVIDDKGRRTGRRHGIAKTETWAGRDLIESLFRRGRSELSTPGLVFRRAALAAFEFDETLPVNWGDFTVLMRMAEQWDVAVVTDALYSWRVHGQNSSSIAISEAVFIRVRVMLDYCAEYASRHPDDRAFVSRLQRHVRRSTFRGLLWGWLAAPDAREAGACRRLLESPHPATARVLGFLELAGVTVERRRVLLPAVRGVARLLRA